MCVPLLQGTSAGHKLKNKVYFQCEKRYWDFGWWGPVHDETWLGIEPGHCGDSTATLPLSERVLTAGGGVMTWNDRIKD